MKKVVMILAAVATMFAVAACGNNKTAEQAAKETTECCGECEGTCEECEKACEGECENCTEVADSTVVAE